MQLVSIVPTLSLNEQRNSRCLAISRYLLLRCVSFNLMLALTLHGFKIYDLRLVRLDATSNRFYSTYNHIVP